MSRIRLLGAIFALIMSLGTVVSAAADTQADANGGLQTRAALCPDCGGSIYLVSTVYGEWGFVGERKCLHEFPAGTDAIFTRSGTSTWKCNGCQRVSSTVLWQERDDCHGYWP